ncbi:hypothetical protein BT67DRAFT_237287 [Trichocladium antarcticum]|uniref:Cytochrome b5 heme-binding domain-containing protein n=1 Tax=Trichocladium antarcticum TaxID=1450529 RepID=A0AAN6UNQ3_9PEZI|nr:hypothetical protein BT67DRAFT_237287 [Trichocladium antarcticum]
MALLGLSLILATVVLFCMRRPAWFPSLFGGSPRPARESPPIETQEAGNAAADHATAADESTDGTRKPAAIPAPPRVIAPDAEVEVDIGIARSPGADAASDDGQATPKASAVRPSHPVPALALSGPEPPQPPTAPTPSTLMPPPPRPPTLRPTNPTTAAAAARRTLPTPDRQPGSSTLAPPPSHSSKPAKPSRTVVLSPGHSPLDWARLSSDPGADLRGLARDSPYLRVTPSMLRRQTGRRGKDAWTVLGGKVYNISPYAKFHPGGVPELMRAAGRDGTRLFGEVHPWVNYEGMLAACLVGIFVAEEDEVVGSGGGGAGAGAGAGDMEAMD